MSFAVHGDQIRQSGTDTDLSGLSSISQAKKTVFGSYTLYNIENNGLVVQGNLTIDPYKEILISNKSSEGLAVESSGTLNLNPSQTVNS